VLSIAGGNAGGNAMNLNNPDIDAAVLEVRAAKDANEKKAALDELAALWREVMPTAIYESTMETIASAKDVHGLKLNVSTTVMFDEAWIG
jgi:ABC-type transport system substrate-binding protein